MSTAAAPDRPRDFSLFRPDIVVIDPGTGDETCTGDLPATQEIAARALTALLSAGR